MSNTHYAFERQQEPRPQEKLVLRNVASARYGGDWHSIPHAHSYTELFYITGGDGQFQLDDRRFPVRAHQLVVVNPNILHTEVSYEAHPLEYIVVGIEGLALSRPDSEDGQGCVYTFSQKNSVVACMQRLLREMREQTPGYQTVCRACMDILIVELMRSADVSLSQSATSANNRQCAAVRQYIDLHYKEKLTLDQLAEEVSVNKYYLAHAFKQEYGISPINYLIACRIREGKRLLTETDLSLSQIAGILGFSSASYFSQSFRTAESMSPTDYRKANRTQP